MKDYVKDTLDYYEKNALEYTNKWITEFQHNTDFVIPKIFLEYIPKKGHILDLGCGPGRDSNFFLTEGYRVTSIDGSQEFCKIAMDKFSIPVINMNFLDINFSNEFDGVFACGSILHLDNVDLAKVLTKIHESLKEKGILYCSFKEGQTTRIYNGRFYNDMTKEKMIEILNKLAVKYKMLRIWTSEQYASESKFINFIIRKETI